jgi:hypothetical protein
MKTDPGVDEVWAAYLEQWRARLGKGPEPKLTKNRRLQIERRLGEFSKDLLIEAVQCMWSNHWRIVNGFTLPEQVFKSTEQVEKVLAAGRKDKAPKAPTPTRAEDPHVDAGETDGVRMLQRVLPEFGYVAALDPMPNSAKASLGQATFEPTSKGARMVLTADFPSEGKLRKCLIALEKLGVLKP